MKAHSMTLLVLFLSALLFAGCGKSAEQKQMESDLNKRVMQLHDSGMAKMRQAQGLESQLDSAKVLNDSMAAKFPRDAANHGSGDIDQAKGKCSRQHREQCTLGWQGISRTTRKGSTMMPWHS